jgi:hypothetical protein
MDAARGTSSVCPGFSDATHREEGFGSEHAGAVFGEFSHRKHTGKNQVMLRNARHTCLVVPRARVEGK